MRRVVIWALAVSLLLIGGKALAYEPKVWEDLSWWGQSGSTPGPYKDPVRSGYWWWPTEPAANPEDAELWGNRGVVYGMYEEVAPPPPPPPPPPVRPTVERTVPLFEHVLFDFDKAVLKPEGKGVVDKVIANMKEFAKDTAVIEGHTCNIGTDEYNTGLGQRRADAVAKYMTDNGIDAARLKTVSLGESQPAVPNDTPANRKLNRRVEIKITIQP